MKNLFKTLNFQILMKTKGIFITSIALICCVVLSCKNNDDTNPENETGTVNIVISHQANSDPFKLNTPYTNAYGNEFSITELKYYISNITFIKDGQPLKVPKKDNYHLVTATTASSTFDIQIEGVPVGEYDQITFAIGVDEEANHDISRNEGDLDPAGSNGMIWNWDTGYKFLVLEGNYTTDDEEDIFIFHVGYNEQYKEYQFNKNITVSESTVTDVQFSADVMALFDGPNTINLIETNTAHGENAHIIAENYGSGFITLP